MTAHNPWVELSGTVVSVGCSCGGLCFEPGAIEWYLYEAMCRGESPYRGERKPDPVIEAVSGPVLLW